ncbi:putative transposase [Shigella flexneri K-1770]|nr:putative transposase [Shigella flexneri K-1770]
MLPRFADIFQQGNRWLNWLEKQPEGAVRPVVIESVTKIMALRDHTDGLHAVVLFITGLLPYKKGLLPV